MKVDMGWIIHFSWVMGLLMVISILMVISFVKVNEVLLSKHSFMVRFKAIINIVVYWHYFYR